METNIHCMTYPSHVRLVFQRRIDEQQSELSRYDSDAGHCVGELQKAQDQVGLLQAKIRESETRNQVRTRHHHQLHILAHLRANGKAFLY